MSSNIYCRSFLVKSRLSGSCWWFLRWSLKGGSSVFFLHDGRSFTDAADDTLPLSSPRVQILRIRYVWRLTFSSLWQQILCWRSGWRLSFLVIMTLSLNRHSERGKNAVWERWETATWQWVKNLFPWWHLTVLLTTAGDPSLWRLMFLVIQLKFIMLF